MAAYASEVKLFGRWSYEGLSLGDIGELGQGFRAAAAAVAPLCAPLPPSLPCPAPALPRARRACAPAPRLLPQRWRTTWPLRQRTRSTCRTLVRARRGAAQLALARPASASASAAARRHLPLPLSLPRSRAVPGEALSQGAVPDCRAAVQCADAQGPQQRQEAAGRCVRRRHARRGRRAAPRPPPPAAPLPLPRPVAVRIVQQAFEIVHLLTDENPLQVRERRASAPRPPRGRPPASHRCAPAATRH